MDTSMRIETDESSASLRTEAPKPRQVDTIFVKWHHFTDAVLCDSCMLMQANRVPDRRVLTPRTH